MRTATCFLLVCISLLHLMVLVNTEGTLDFIVEQKVKELLRHRDVAPTATQTFSCTSIQASGRLATCPSGMVVTGCACGYGCGSWDIRNENTCHCQCSVMDWASARCCKLS